MPTAHGAQTAASLLAAMALTAIAAVARAGTIEVAPVSHELVPGQKTTTMTLHNPTTQETSIQIRAYRWTQQEGEDKLDPTNDVVLSPPIFKLASNASQIVRIVVRQPAKDTESTYRMIVDEIPSPDAAGGVRFALRISIPIFLAAKDNARPKLRWRVDPASQTLVVNNVGARHTRVREMSLSAEGQPPVTPTAATTPYVLAGAERRYALKDAGALLNERGKLRLTVTTDEGREDVPITVTP